MKKKKNLRLTLKKEKISELDRTNQRKILGGSYPSACGCNGGSNTCSLSCSGHACG